MQSKRCYPPYPHKFRSAMVYEAVPPRVIIANRRSTGSHGTRRNDCTSSSSRATITVYRTFPTSPPRRHDRRLNLSQGQFFQFSDRRLYQPPTSRSVSLLIFFTRFSTYLPVIDQRNSTTSLSKLINEVIQRNESRKRS